MLYTQHSFLPPRISRRDVMQMVYTGLSIFSSVLYMIKYNIFPYLANRISCIGGILKQVFR